MAITAFARGDISEKLHQWALWSRGDGLGAAKLRRGDCVVPDITDEEGAVMDRCVLELKHMGDWRAYEVICRHYQRNRSLAEIGEELNCKPRMVRDIHDNARFYLDGQVKWALTLAKYRPNEFLQTIPCM